MPPAPPWFRGRSLALARFGVWCHIVPVDGLLRGPCTCPDLETFFRENAFQHIFLENASQIGFSIPEVTASRPLQRQPPQKPASGNERLSKAGVQGRSPGPLSPHFSGEMGTPAGQAGPPGRCAPRPGKAPTTHRVRTTAPRPHGCGHISRANSAAPRAPHSWASGWMNRGCPSFSWMASTTPWFRATPPVIMQGPVPPARR